MALSREWAPRRLAPGKCRYQAELSLETLVRTRGRNMPLTGLSDRMMCPRCGNGRVNLIFEPPPKVERRSRVDLSLHPAR